MMSTGTQRLCEDDGRAIFGQGCGLEPGGAGGVVEETFDGVLDGAILQRGLCRPEALRKVQAAQWRQGLGPYPEHCACEKIQRVIIKGTAHAYSECCGSGVIFAQ